MHACYRATIEHKDGSKTEYAVAVVNDAGRFLALDKPMPRRTWFELLRLERGPKPTDRATVTFLNIPQDQPQYRRKVVPEEEKKKPIDPEPMKTDTPTVLPQPELKKEAKEEEKKAVLTAPTVPPPAVAPQQDCILRYDLEWLAATRAVEPLLSLKRYAEYVDLLGADKDYLKSVPFRGKPFRWGITFVQLREMMREEMESLRAKLGEEKLRLVPMAKNQGKEEEHNPQTKQFLELVGMESKMYPKPEELKQIPAGTTKGASEEIDIVEFCYSCVPCEQDVQPTFKPERCRPSVN